MTKVVPHFAEWTVRTNKGRSAQRGAGKSAETGLSASCGRGCFTDKTSFLI